MSKPLEATHEPGRVFDDVDELCGPATFVTIREIPPGRTGIGSCSPRGTPACSFIACCS